MSDVYKDKQFLQPYVRSDDCQLQIGQSIQDKKCKSCVKRLQKYNSWVEHLAVINTLKVIEKVKQTFKENDKIYRNCS